MEQTSFSNTSKSIRPNSFINLKPFVIFVEDRADLFPVLIKSTNGRNESLTNALRAFGKQANEMGCITFVLLQRRSAD